MLHGMIHFPPAALFPVPAFFAFLAPPLEEATPERLFSQPGNSYSSVPALLLVSSRQPPRWLEFLEGMAMEIFVAASVRDARRQLGGTACYDLLLVDAELPDGTWQDLLPFVFDWERPCEMIVYSRLGDERLWVEVISQGAFDLIPEPYEGREVLRIIQSALKSQSLRRSARKKAA